MAESADTTPEFARHLADSIVRHAADYAGDVTVTDRDGLIHDEKKLLEQFEVSLARALERYRPPRESSRETVRLVFQCVYDAADKADEDERRAALLAALLAGQVEASNAHRLTRRLKKQLAQMLQCLGQRLREDRLLLHAAQAFDDAAGLYKELEEHTPRDECLYSAADARRVAMPRGWKRCVQSMNRALVGYGYRPFLMLRWIGVEVFVCCLILLALPANREESRAQTVYIGFQNLINPMGVGDTQNINHVAWLILTVESYLGAISIDVFLVLLTAKLFRR
jgi:hypothetical protein